MSALARVVTVVGIALAIGACGGHAATPRPTTGPTPAPTDPAPPTAPTAPPAKDPLPAQVEAIVHGYETLASAAGPAAPCGALADAITGAAASTADARAAVSVASRGERAADVDALMVAAAPRLTAALATLDAAATRCAGEPRVATALEAFDR